MTGKTDMTQEMPLCEGKEVLNKLQNMVKSFEPVQQIPQVLINSDDCSCGKDQPSQCCHEIQKMRATNKPPPQSFDLKHLIAEADEKFKSAENVGTKGDVGSKEQIKLGKESENNTDKKTDQKDIDNDDRRNIITVQRMCKGHLDDTNPPEIKAMLKEGKLPGENEEVCIKDPKTGTFTCYTVKAGGRVIKQITDSQPLPEERKVEPHPILPIPKPSTNYELRGSKMYVGCNCLKRNGMQHDCPRSECQGKRECLKFPAPVCQPSGLAPPIIKISPITTAIEPDCGPKKKVQTTKTEMEKRKVLLDYARAQYFQWPPSSRVPCKQHKKGLYYIRPLRKVADAQTDIELIENYLNSEEYKNQQLSKSGVKSDTGILGSNKDTQNKENVRKEDKNGQTRKSGKDMKGEEGKLNKMDETFKMLEKDLNLK